LLLLESGIENLRFGDEYSKVEENINSIRAHVTQIDTYKKCPDMLTLYYFSDLKNEVNLIRDVLVVEIDKCTSDLLDEINEYEANCKQVKLVDKDDVSMQRIKSELGDWEKKIKRITIDEALWSKINLKSTEFLTFLKEDATYLKESIFLGALKKKEFENRFLNLREVFSKRLGFQK
jgi:hypothetical protein